MSNCFVSDATWAPQCSLFLSHVHTHPLGSAPALCDGLGEAKLFLPFSWLRSLRVCKRHVYVCGPLTAWRYAWLHWKMCKIANGNVLNVQKVENAGKVETCLREPVWFSEVSKWTGNFRGQICFQVQQTHGQLHTVCCSSKQKKGNWA